MTITMTMLTTDDDYDDDDDDVVQAGSVCTEMVGNDMEEKELFQ